MADGFPRECPNWPCTCLLPHVNGSRMADVLTQLRWTAQGLTRAEAFAEMRKWLPAAFDVCAEEIEDNLAALPALLDVVEAARLCIAALERACTVELHDSACSWWPSAVDRPHQTPQTGPCDCWAKDAGEAIDAVNAALGSLDRPSGAPA